MANTNLSTSNAEEKRPYPVRKIVIGISITLLALVLLAAGSFGIYVAVDPYDFRMVEGVTLGGLDISGKTPFEARKALTTAAEEQLLTAGLELELQRKPSCYTPSRLNCPSNPGAR